MFKAKMNTGGLVFGLSRENINRLQKNEPIVFNLKDMGLEDRTVMICFGETEEALYESMIDHINIDKTKIHF